MQSLLQANPFSPDGTNTCSDNSPNWFISTTTRYTRVMVAMTTPDPMTLVYNWRWVGHDEILDLVLLVTEATMNLRLVDDAILKVDELDPEVFQCGQT